jgi:ribosome-associated protein
VKAQNIVVFNTEQLSPLFERVIIASGTSNRQTKALAASVRDAVKGKGLTAPRTEGEDNGEWIIVDCGAAVVHVMQPAIRDYYRLEEIWGGKPVKLKVDTAPVKLVKASEEPAPVARKAAPKKSPLAGRAAAPARKAAPAKAPAKKSVAAKAPAKKAPARKPITRSVGVKVSAAAKKAPARKRAAKA